MAGVSWRPDPLWIRQSKALEGRFPSYRYSQVISCPFLGADGAGRACKEAGWPYEMVNGIDVNTKLEASLKQLHGEGHQGIMIKDFRNVNFDMSPPSDRLIGTSPCAVFSLLGTNDKISLSGGWGGSLSPLAGVHSQLGAASVAHFEVDLPRDLVRLPRQARTFPRLACCCRLVVGEHAWVGATDHLGS